MRRICFAAGQLAEVEQAPEPVPGPGQLLVRTEAIGAGVGLVRLLASAGERGEPVQPGGEVVGTVVALGPDVTGFQLGDRVGGVVFEDAFADLVVADPRLVSLVPAHVDAAAALALVRGGLIALSALRVGHFQHGQSVLVTAAASGTGHLAVQLARALGASRVIGVVGSADKTGFVRQCGADEVVTYAQPSWGDPVDVVLDGVGGEVVQRGVDSLAPFGRLVAFSAGGGSADVGSLLGNIKSVIGFTIGQLNRTQPELVERHRAELWELLAADRLRPRYTDLPLEQIAKAIELITARANLGRVALRTT
ncbi:zinc-binding dehydrogenase [Micromonospora sp. WP24]|uniref:quinone oxidoreductase family protein n=1 Tax=Micromonospora sp. WP24 TaxID=2604469 RepID=UPI0011DB617B|nr:zinc-binding dehydrogenase [Micromonospora sp. WP24]TYB95464.1 zinc-binding dehydrogenase [Micromonospora sp. WP24]